MDMDFLGDSRMEMRTVEVALGADSYPIYIGEDTLGEVVGAFKAAGVRGTVGLVTDSNVVGLYGERVKALVEGAGYGCVVHVMAVGEAHKRLEAVEGICGTFLEGGLDRTSMVVAVGGGVVGDVAGFAAASFMRGIPFVQVPTTVVAQVDSSVGGKTGVNHPLGKNTIGAFHQPSAVVIDLSLLRSLPARELRAGLAEVIKHGIIADAALFAYMEEHIEALLAIDLDAFRYPVLRSCEIKSAIVAEDEKEHGKRANLNYGHTFGHAIESVTGYTKFLHGEAIALGMCAAGALARDLGLVDDGFVARQRACFEAYGLPTVWAELPVSESVEAMKKDKKARAGTLKFVLATGIGSVVHRSDVSEKAVRQAFESIRGTL